MHVIERDLCTLAYMIKGVKKDSNHITTKCVSIKFEAQATENTLKRQSREQENLWQRDDA